MPSLLFDVQEVEETKTKKVNKSGYLYVGRKHSGKDVVWIRLKKCPKRRPIKPPLEMAEYKDE